LEILSTYYPKGKEAEYFLDADHDVISSHIGLDQIPMDGEHGQLLEALGWHFDTDVEAWAYFT